ncbi:hypothetical protein RJ639_000838 [Escallonia herrerae]|uniref:BTB domain-containing protein n=1 Tax=Escallonia herrerae TaxID=1293975 RepID=A0AA89BSR3_9ASTE|nr:hypothetical protein RJ639_000838 [Escallonia herrerae]
MRPSLLLSSKKLQGAAENNRAISGHILTVHQRLNHALSLGQSEVGIKCGAKDGRDYTKFSSPTSFFEDGLPFDMFVIFPRIPCCCFLCNCFGVHPVKFVSEKRKRREILREKNAVGKILHNMHDFPGGSMPVVYPKEMVSLLSRILWRWPSFRFCVSDDTKAMEVLGSISLEPDFTTKVAILQLYSTSNGANKLLDTGQNLLRMMVQSMGSSNPHSVKVAALTFLFDRSFVSSRFNYGLSRSAQISEQGCSRLMKMCCEPLINAIISGMSDWSLVSGKLTKQQISLFGEACRLAMITRWAGEQHKHFWKLGVEKVLLQLLLNNNHETFLSQNLEVLIFTFVLSLDQQIAIANKGGRGSSHLFLRPYIWDILGWLATNCAEDFDPKKLGNELNINMLITCACLAFVDSVRTRPTCATGSVCRAVLLMLYSPSKFIASQARSVLCEVLKPHGKVDIKHLLTTLNATSSGDKFTVQDNLQITIYLLRLVCYLALPRYPMHVVKNHGIKTLLAFIKGWLSSPVHIKRSSLAPHLRTSFHEKTCCYDYAGDWEGEDMLLLYGLWGLAELIRQSGSVKNHAHTSAQLVSQLEEICICDDSYAPGSRWFAAYLLSYFGLYGFPTKLGKRIGEALKEKKHTDLKLILRDQEAFSVHGIIVTTRCPPLLPPGKLQPSKKTSSDISEDVKKTEVCLSSRVDHEVLLKVLDFVYSGYLEAGEDLVKKLKVFARHCKLQSMLQILCRKDPKWGSPLPSFNLIFAHGSSGKLSSVLQEEVFQLSILWILYKAMDIILEAEEDHLRQWKCNICCLSVSHIHAHKVILSSSCEYLQALFRSGMRERISVLTSKTGSQTIKVPISWKALVRLIKWFYLDELQKPASGCLWDNLDADEKLCELKPYIELCWLAKFWLIGNDLCEDCLRVVMSCLDSTKYLSVKVIQFAVGFSLWELAKVAANHMAPFYHHLHNSGEIEELDEELIEMVRVASVQLLQ